MAHRSTDHHDPTSFWSERHGQERFRPIYPNEDVVRFLMTRYRRALGEGVRLRALDIGCGAGRHTRLLCDLGFETSGIDISPEGVEQSRKMLASFGYTPFLRQAPMTALPFEENTFDTAISVGVYYYGTAAEMRSAIRDLFRVLKPGGESFILVRSTEDYRFGKGTELEPNTFLLDIEETSEKGTVQHFLTQPDIDDYFADFSERTVEKTETSFNGLRAWNSDWLISVKK